MLDRLKSLARFHNVRLRRSRAAALIAIVVALTTVCGLVARHAAQHDRPTRRGRDGIFRIARGGPQRLDSSDAVAFDESPDPILSPTADATPDVPSLSSPTRGLHTVGSPSARASRPNRIHAVAAPPVPVAGPPGDAITLQTLPDPPSLLSRTRQPILGRAPPSPRPRRLFSSQPARSVSRGA